LITGTLFDTAITPDGRLVLLPSHEGSSVAEFGLRSYQTLREWAQWALDNMGATDPGTAQEPPPRQ
jgi:hypothetical protein